MAAVGQVSAEPADTDRSTQHTKGLLGTPSKRFFEALGTFLSSDRFTQARVMLLVITLVRNAVIDP